jgi:hypothetical protein
MTAKNRTFARWSRRLLPLALALPWAASAATFLSFLGGEAGRIYTMTADGTLWFYWDLNQNGTPGWANNGIGASIGSAWQSFSKVLYGQNGIIYAITLDGRLLYYKDLARNGTFSWDPASGAQIGAGWGAFKWVWGDTNGVIYAIDNAGALWFYQHTTLDQYPNWAYGGAGQQIGTYWHKFKNVFSGRDGVIYAIAQDGTLYYYRDLARDGTFNWANNGLGLAIGTGWAGFKAVFSTGNGNIYGVNPNGDMYFYHVDVAGTNANWNYGTVIGGGFVPNQIAGYCWPLSGAPGQTIDFRVSGYGPLQVTYNRHKGNSSDNVMTALLTSNLVVNPQSVPADPARYGCGWSSSFNLTIPSNWTSGIYSALCRRDGEEFHITFVVRTPRPQRSDVALLSSINTWHAYNDWPGGASKYNGRAHLSLFRPNPAASPVIGDLHLARGELWVLGWLQDQGYQPDFYSDQDYHNDGSALSHYKCLVLNTHPEYWTLQMRHHLEQFLAAGGSVLYLGGNGIYEEGEYTPDQTGMVFLAGVEGGPRAPALFRNLNPPLPEAAILGVGYEDYLWGTAGPYEVMQAGHPLFAGTGLTNGQTFGEVGLNTVFGNGAACGWEVDDTYAGGTPANVTVLATGHDSWDGSAWSGGQMVYYPNPGGGLVFSVGSLAFAGSLAVDARIQQIVRNALTQALALPRPRPILYNPQRLGGTFSFSFDTVSGLSYVVQSKDTLSAATWNTLQTIPGDGNEKIATDSSASGGQRFYRVWVQ